MPKPRQRIVFCDCLDCLDGQNASVTSSEALAAAEAVAKQLPPPKALMLIVTNALCTENGVANVDNMSLPHIDKSVADGAMGLLSVRQRSNTDSLSAAEAEVSQLLGVYEEVCIQLAEEKELAEGSLTLTQVQKRFKDLSACIASTSARISTIATAAGFAPIDVLSGASNSEERPHEAVSTEKIGQTLLPLALPPPEVVAERLLTSLALDEPSEGTDLLVMHVDTRDAIEPLHTSTTEAEASHAVLLWLDNLVRALLTVTAARERMLLTIVLTPAGRALPGLNSAASPLQPAHTLDPGSIIADLRFGMPSSGLSLSTEGEVPHVRRPLQSWQVNGTTTLDIDLTAPLLVIRRLAGVVRRDRCRELSLAEALERSGEGAILADRVLHEIAYKIGRAPKYGA